MTEQAKIDEIWDDPVRDFRQRYYLPDQFMWDKNDWARIIFDGYTTIAISLLPKPPAYLLDAGCGPGLGVKVMCEQGYKVVGIDYNERGIKFARLLVPNAEFFLADLRQLRTMKNFQEKFDAVTHIEVLEHIPPNLHEKVLQNIRSTLKPSGILVLTVPSTRTLLNKWHYKHFSLNEIVHLVNENGLEVTQTVCQERVSTLFSSGVRRFFTNKYYDIRFARHILRLIFLRWYNHTNEPTKAGRFVIQARRSE